MTKEKLIYFYIGTEAELLKLLPVIKELENRDYPFKVIFSGQNKIGDSYLLGLLNKKEPDILITKKQLKQSVISLFTWFFWALYRTIFVLRLVSRGISDKKIIVVQGDTLSTVIGSVAGKLCGFKVAHVEAGYRSHNWFQPFPEEIDRVIVSYFADYHFYPNQELLVNIQKRQGQKIWIKYNTNIDSLNLALRRNSHVSEKLVKGNAKYFIFIMHRQENMLNKGLINKVLTTIDSISQEISCVFIKHSYTDEVVRGHRFKGRVRIVSKIPFFDFISLLKKSEFIITDGGGNQQESYFLGKPCLILRKVTEGKEGLGKNAVLSGLDVRKILSFAKNYQKYQKGRIITKISPSKIIIDSLLK